jgi:ketosteroid isomerase-like protein
MSIDSEIRKLINDRASAIRDRDARAAVGFYAEDVVNFDLAPPLAYRGSEAIDPGELQGWFDSWSGPINLAFDRLIIRSDGDLAFAHGLLHMTGPRTDGSVTDIWARMTLCFERRDRHWKIMHEHQSFPTQMDGSGLSASGLKP